MSITSRPSLHVIRFNQTALTLFLFILCRLSQARLFEETKRTRSLKPGNTRTGCVEPGLDN